MHREPIIAELYDKDLYRNQALPISVENLKVDYLSAEKTTITILSLNNTLLQKLSDTARYTTIRNMYSGDILYSGIVSGIYKDGSHYSMDILPILSAFDADFGCGFGPAAAKKVSSIGTTCGDQLIFAMAGLYGGTSRYPTMQTYIFAPYKYFVEGTTQINTMYVNDFKSKNVFESIGCCGKINSENIKWFGLSRIPETLESIQLSLRVNNPAATLDDIFQTQKNISISNLTVSFLLCYLVMRISAVDIKHVAMFLSRSNQRYKTTLCKLYQVTHILEAAGIIQRSMMPCVMVLDPKYLVFVKMGEAQVPDPTSISYFLNDHKSNNELIYAIEKRRVEFFSGYKRIECRPYHYRTKIPHLLV